MPQRSGVHGIWNEYVAHWNYSANWLNKKLPGSEEMTTLFLKMRDGIHPRDTVAFSLESRRSKCRRITFFCIASDGWRWVIYGGRPANRHRSKLAWSSLHPWPDGIRECLWLVYSVLCGQDSQTTMKRHDATFEGTLLGPAFPRSGETESKRRRTN